MTDLLHVGDLSFDPEDLTFGEKREVRRIVRAELWDADVMGEFDWAEVPDEEVVAATIAVWMRRENPQYTLDEALALKPKDVIGEDVPPTESRSSSRNASGRKKTSAAAGTQS
jgi:hypothetical protein